MGNSLDVTTHEMDRRMCQDIDIGDVEAYMVRRDQADVDAGWTVCSQLPVTINDSKPLRGYTTVGKPVFCSNLSMYEFEEGDTIFVYSDDADQAFPQVARYTEDTSNDHPEWKPVVFLSPWYQTLYQTRMKSGWEPPPHVRRVFLNKYRQGAYRKKYLHKWKIPDDIPKNDPVGVVTDFEYFGEGPKNRNTPEFMQWLCFGSV